MKWLLFLDLDGTFWDHLDVSAMSLPFESVRENTIRDEKGETLTIKPGVLDFIAWVKETGGILSSCSWNKPEMALAALETLRVADLFDHQGISVTPRKYILMEDLLSRLKNEGLSIPQEHVYYIDDRDIHMDDIRRRLPRINFLHMWKDAGSYEEARRIIAGSLGLRP